jgi:SOS-response transcriptional repressor LexA
MSFQLTVKRLREDMEQIHFQYSNLLYEKIKLSKNHFHGKKIGNDLLG